MKWVDEKVLPSSLELERELKREQHRCRYSALMRSTLCMLITVAATAVLVASFGIPVLQIYGCSMSPTLEDGQIVLAVKSHDLHQGDVVAFYCNNKILVKRVIAQSGDWVEIGEDGTVSVNDEVLTETYLQEKSAGISDLVFPCQVPDGKIFVLGDHRETSVDSRNSEVGFISGEMIVGKIVFCIWPLAQIGGI